MMDPHSFLYDLSHGLDRRQLTVLFVKHLQGSAVNKLNALLLSLSGEVILRADRFRIGLYVFFAEAEDDHWIQLPLHDGFDDFAEV